jgi:hypothetical protein
MVKALAPRGRAVVVSLLVTGVCVLAFAVHAEGAPAQATPKPAWRVSKTFGADVPESITAPESRDAWLAVVEPNCDVFAEHWNGTAWRAIRWPSGAFTDGGVTIAASSASNVWMFTLVTPAVANASYTVAWRWNGRDWSRDRFAGSVEIFAASVFSRTDAWAFGEIAGRNGKTAPYVARFDGRRWLRVRAPFAPTAASAVSANDIWIVGQVAPEPNTFEAANWVGGSWHIRRLPSLRVPRNDSSERPGILALSPDSVWVDSTVWHANGQVAEQVLMHYDGTSWARVRVPFSSITKFMAMTPDGVGGIWIGADTSKLPGGVMYGYRNGHWSRQLAPVRRGDYTGLESMATKPGSTTAWAVGYAGKSKGNPDAFGVLYDYAR